METGKTKGDETKGEDKTILTTSQPLLPSFSWLSSALRTSQCSDIDSLVEGGGVLEKVLEKEGGGGGREVRRGGWKE